MTQNRNKLIDLFIGNISNSVVHKILEKAIDDRDIWQRYEKESITSWKIAKKYREKINPVYSSLPEKDIRYIKTKVINKVESELTLRISKGYENISLDLIEELVDKILKEINIT